MSPFVLVFATVIIVAFVSLSIISVKKHSPLVAWLMTIAAVPLLAFFCFGFAASFEGSGGMFLWFRMIYVALFCIVSAAVAAAWWPSWLLRD